MMMQGLPSPTPGTLSPILRKSGSTSTILRPGSLGGLGAAGKGSGGYAGSVAVTSSPISSPTAVARSYSLASLQDAVAGVASPAVAGVARPASRGATSRRRPAPKIITDGALQLGTRGLLSPSNREASFLAEGLADILKADLRDPLPSSQPKSSAASSMQGTAAASGLADLNELNNFAQAQCSSNPRCTISSEADGSSEIRTKVFRMGAPLLRSTIPVALGTRRSSTSSFADVAVSPTAKTADGRGVDADSASDAEEILSMSDGCMEDQGTLSVTLDFPC